MANSPATLTLKTKLIPGLFTPPFPSDLMHLCGVLWNYKFFGTLPKLPLILKLSSYSVKMNRVMKYLSWLHSEIKNELWHSLQKHDVYIVRGYFYATESSATDLWSNLRHLPSLSLLLFRESHFLPSNAEATLIQVALFKSFSNVRRFKLQRHSSFP